MFTVRTTKPSNNKYYITTDKGGYSWAIKGSPTDPTANVLANCVGYANGRYAEIIHEESGYNGIQYQLVCNAENFIEKAKSYGLKISDKPTLGGIMVWQKGSLSGDDGAGHVAVVEKIYNSNKIYTSESGWGASSPFWNSTRTNDNGRWGQGSAYKFRGCIVNPAVKEEPEIPIVGNPVKRNNKVDQLEVITDTLRARENPNLKAKVFGYVKQGIYDVKGVTEADGYVWYQVDTFWCANDKDSTWCKFLPSEYVGKPVNRDETVDQIQVTASTLRARTEPNLKGEVLGFANKGIYNCIDRAEADGYKWFKTDQGFWVAQSKDGKDWVTWMPKMKYYDFTIKHVNDDQALQLMNWCVSNKVEYTATEVK